MRILKTRRGWFRFRWVLVALWVGGLAGAMATEIFSLPISQWVWAACVYVGIVLSFLHPRLHPTDAMDRLPHDDEEPSRGE